MKHYTILFDISRSKTPTYWFRRESTEKGLFYHDIYLLTCKNPTKTLTKGNKYYAIFLSDAYRPMSRLDHRYVDMYGLINDNGQYVEVKVDRFEILSKDAESNFYEGYLQEQKQVHDIIKDNPVPSLDNSEGYVQLAIIIEKAIDDKDYDKLRFIGQSLDVMCFQKKYKHYYALFYRIDHFLQSFSEELLVSLKVEHYDDLLKLNLSRCETFGSYKREYGVETTNEQPIKEDTNMCPCGSTIPKNGCGSMWCPSNPSN